MEINSHSSETKDGKTEQIGKCEEEKKLMTQTTTSFSFIIACYVAHGTGTLSFIADFTEHVCLIKQCG